MTNLMLHEIPLQANGEFVTLCGKVCFIRVKPLVFLSLFWMHAHIPSKSRQISYQENSLWFRELAMQFK